MLVRAVLIAWLVTEVVFQIRTRRSGRPVSDWTYYVLIAASIISIGAGFGLARIRWGDFDGDWLAIAVGLGLVLGGVAFRVWSMITLGRFFTFRVSIQEDHRVVQTGPYSFVRHPGYTGALVACLGLGIALEATLSMTILVLLPLAATLVRIRVEERELTSGLGDEYRRYANGKKRLMPHIW
jgi:protein-S-isoprenylcysteine O-methyltransferase Ste14